MSIASVLAAVMQNRELGEFEKCPCCHIYDFMNIHQCKPTWEVIRIDYNEEDDPVTVYADDAEAAAIKYADEQFSNWEYPSEVEIWARKSEDDPWQKFDVSVVSVPSFSTIRKEESN
jgi:hypothetical protein